MTQTDNIWFTLLTVNPNPIHFDAAQQPGPSSSAAGRFDLHAGAGDGDLGGRPVAERHQPGLGRRCLPHPVFDGDTLYARSEVLARESKSQPARGIVQVKTTGFNQDGVIVIEFRRTLMVYKRFPRRSRGPCPISWSPAKMTVRPVRLYNGAMHAAYAYLPADRRRALYHNRTLPAEALHRSLRRHLPASPLTESLAQPG